MRAGRDSRLSTDKMEQFLYEGTIPTGSDKPNDTVNRGPVYHIIIIWVQYNVQLATAKSKFDFGYNNIK